MTPPGAAGRAVGVIVDADAVDAVVVLLRTMAGDGQLVAVAAVAARRGDAVHGLRPDAGDAGLQRGQRRPVTSIERQLDDRSLFDDRAQGRGRRVHRRRRARDGDRLLHPAGCKLEVDGQLGADGDADALADRRREARHRRGELVRARQQVGRAVGAGFVRDHVGADAGRRVENHHMGARQDAAARVDNRAANRAARHLRGRRRRTAHPRGHHSEPRKAEVSRSGHHENSPGSRGRRIAPAGDINVATHPWRLSDECRIRSGGPMLRV